MKYELKGVYNEKNEETIPIFIRLREGVEPSCDFVIDCVDKSGNTIRSSNLLVFKEKNKNGKYRITFTKNVNPDLPFELDTCGHVKYYIQY